MNSAKKIAALSSRELQIARIYAAGSDYRAIAERLFIAPSTVRTHLSTIYRKLDVSSKIDLLRTLDLVDGAHAGTNEIAATSTVRSASVTGRRQVTVLSATLDRFSDLASRLDPEETAGLVAGLREVGTEEVRRRNGTVVQGGANELVACFGAPVAEETDGERAVEAAIAIRERVLGLAAPGGPPLAARIGVFTGAVVTKGSAGVIEEVVGGAPFVAAALASRADGGGIVVCARTRAMAGGLFEYRDLGSIAVESGAEEVRGFAIAGPASVGSRFHALHGAQLTPIVGRDQETGLLVSLFERACEGEGQVALVSGEAGIGKSRVVQALRDRVAVEERSCFLFQCSPNKTASALHPVESWIRRAARLDRHDSPQARAEALVRLFKPVLEDVSLDRLLLAELASIRLEDQAVEDPRTPERRRAATLALLTRLVCHHALAGPVLLLFEDLHWVDPTTLAWVSEVVTASVRLPVLTVATFRPEFRFEGAALPSLTSLSLAKLTRRQAKRIVKQQAGAGALSATLVDQIVLRSDGIPLFAEELTRSILEFEGSPEAVPVTLQASIAARLDRLGSALEVAQAAAVIGRDFELGLLSKLLPHGRGELSKAIESILVSGLVTRGSIGEPESYQFKHALVRDAAHDSLLRAKRESLHRKLAEALAARRAEDHDVPAELIALHFVEGAAPDRSVKFWIEAAHTALARGGQCEAAQFCRQGLGAVQEMSDPVQRSAFECDLQLLLYGAEYSRGDVGLLLGILERAEELAGRLEDPPRLSKVLDMKAYTLASAGRVADGIEAGRQAVAINRDLDDANAFIGANMMLGRALYAAGEYREAVIQARLVRDMLGEDLERGYIAGAMNQTVSSRVWLTFMQAEVGAFDAAEQDIRDAFGLLERMAVNNHERIWAAAAFGRLRHLRGDHAAVIEWLEPLLDLCESEFPVYLARMAMSLGPALVANGQEGRGLELLKRGDELAGANRFKFAHGLLLAELARSLLQAGDAAGAEEIARRAVAVSERAGEGGNAAWARLAAGEAAQAAGSQGEARRLIEAAAGRAEQQGMVPLTRCCRRALPTLGSRALALDLR